MQELFRRNHFFWRRLHSLTGIAPVGGFLMFHLYTNFLAFAKGPEVFTEHVVAINSMPFVQAIELFVIILPLYFHALYGIYIAMDARHAGVSQPYGRNWAFFFQRVSGLITLAFVTQHLFHFRFQKVLGAFEMASYDVVHQGLANPYMRAWYAIGTIAAAYHLANGIYTFCITWGITVGPKSQRILNVITNVAFVGISALGLFALVAFRGL